MGTLDRRIAKFEKRYGHKPVAIITGGSSGMGLCYARELASRGCNLVLVSIQEKELQEQSKALRDEFGVDVKYRYQNLATDNAAEELIAYLDELGIETDILINNAGMFFFKEMSEQLIAKAEMMLKLHIFTVTKLSFLMGLKYRERGYGYILNVSSMADSLPMPGITMYSATKAYLTSFSRSLFFEMRDYGVGVTVVCPAAIATPLYGLNKGLMKLGVGVGLISRPEWLVKRALKGMFAKRRMLRPAFMNIYLPPLIALLPKWAVSFAWNKLKYRFN